MRLFDSLKAFAEQVAADIALLRKRIDYIVSHPTKAVAITPSDTDEFAGVANKIYVGIAGDVIVAMKDGTVVPFLNAAAGRTIGTFEAVKVLKTGTTAGGLIAIIKLPL